MARKKQTFNMMQYGTKNNGRTTLIQRNEKKIWNITFLSTYQKVR